MTHLILSLCLAAGPVTAEVETLGGDVVSGSISQLNERQVVINGGEKPQTIPAADLQQIRIQPIAVPDQDPAAWVDSTDGSQLLVNELGMKDGQCRLRLANGENVTLPARALRSIRFRKQSPTVAAEWSKLLARTPTADMAVLRKSDKLDFLDGVLKEMDEKAAVFSMDDEPVRIARSKLEGLIFFPPREQPVAAAAVVITRDGSRFQVREFALGDGTVQWTTPSGLKLRQPLESIAEFDFTSGKITYLSDLEPQLAQWTPYFSSSKLAEPLAKLFHPRRNQALLYGDTAGDDGALQLRFPGDNGLATVRSYKKGLALHSRSRVVYELPEQFRYLRTIAGIDARLGRQGHVQLKIEGDGRELLSVSISGHDAPRPIDVDIRGVKELVLTVDFGQQLDIGDYLNLCDARLVR